MPPDNQKKGKRGSAFPPTQTAAELLQDQQGDDTPLANHQAPVAPTVTTALDVVQNGTYAALGFHPEIVLARATRKIQIRDYESEERMFLLGGRVDPTIRLDELLPVLEADLDVQLDVWEKKKRGTIAWRRLLRAKQQEAP